MRLRLGLLVVLAVAAAGCGAGKGTVTGTVLLNGKPLPGGLVTFRPADSHKNPVTVRVAEDGRFEAVVPAGEVRIAVDNREFEPPPKAEKIKLPAVGGLPAGVKPDAAAAP